MPYWMPPYARSHLDPTRAADVIVYQDGRGYAVAIGRHGRPVAGPSDEHAEVIQAAVDEGGVILICRGTYVISRTIELPDYTILVGAGRGRTVLRLDDGANTDMFRGKSYSNGYVNLRVEIMSMELDGNKDNNSSGNGLLWNVYQGRILDMSIHDFPGDGIKVYGFSLNANAIENVIARNEIRGNGGAGVELTNTYCTDNHIIGNYISNNGNNGIIVGAAWDQHIHYNHIYANSPYGILVRNAERVRIVGNHIAVISGEAIRIVSATTTYARRHIIVGNHLIASQPISHPAISLIGYDATYLAMYNIIEGNQFLRTGSGSFTYAVEGTNDDYNIVVGNVVDPNAVSSGAFNLTGSNNIVVNNIT